MPEMVAPRALDSCRRPEGSWALGRECLVVQNGGIHSLNLELSRELYLKTFTIYGAQKGLC